MALNKGIWDPKLRGTHIKGTNLQSLSLEFRVLCVLGFRTLNPKPRAQSQIARMGTNLMYNMATASAEL